MSYTFDGMTDYGISYFVNFQKRRMRVMNKLYALVEQSMFYKKKSAISKFRFQEQYPSKGIVLPIKVKTNHWSIFRQATFLFNMGSWYWHGASNDYQIPNVMFYSILNLKRFLFHCCTLIDKNNVRWYINFDEIAYLSIRHVTDNLRKT